MDHKQPNVVNVRNGPSRGRSRSVSRSRSRSRSPPSAAREPPRDVVIEDQRSWTLAPHGDQLWGEMLLRRNTEIGATVTLRQMKAVVGPKTDQALTKLLAASDLVISRIELDDAIPISTLAQAAGPETMPPRCLCEILMEVRKDSEAQQAAKDKEAAESTLRTLRAMGQKVTLDELDKKTIPAWPKGDASAMEGTKAAYIKTRSAFLRLATEVGNKHPDIGLDTMIDLDVVAAETGPETMPLSSLIKLVLTTPDTAPGGETSVASVTGITPINPSVANVQDEQVNNGNPYQRNAAILASFEQQLAEERAKLPAYRAQNAAILAASTNPYSAYYQSLAAPATTQGNVQQQPSIFNPTLSRWQQELDEQARALGARFP